MSSRAGHSSMRRVRTRAFLLFLAIVAGAGAASGSQIQDSAVSVPGGSGGSGTASAGDAAARKAAKDAGIDLGSVIETVRHHVGSAGDGVSVAQDGLYRAEFTSSGFGLTLRDVISDEDRSKRTRVWRAAGGGAPSRDAVLRGSRPSGLPGEAVLSGLPAEAIPFQSVAAFRMEVASVEMGGARAAADRRSWKADRNVASRRVAAGVIERVTAREGRVEWDFVLDTPVSTGLLLDVRVAAAGAPVLTRTGVKGHPELPATAWRYPVADGRAVRVGEIVVKDAAGRALWRGLPEASLGRMRLRIPATVLKAAVYPVTVDPTVGPEYPASDPVYGSASGNQIYPSIAWNGSNFLVAWQDSRAGTSDVYASRVSSAGAVLDAGGIAVSTAANIQLHPVVAWNGSDFLVAWSDYRSGTNYDAYAARVSGAGVVLDAGGIAVSTAANDQVPTTIASDGSSFLVVWQDTRSASFDIYASRVSGSGVVLDAAGIAVSTGGPDKGSPSVAWNGSNFLVAWEDFRSGNGDIYASRVSGAGVVLDAAGIAVSTPASGQFSPAVASDGSNFLVAWYDYRSVNGDIYAARVSGAGVVLDATGIAVSTAAGDQLYAAVAWNGSNFLVAWTDNRSGASSDIYASRVSSAGVVLDASGIAVSTAAGGQHRVKVASDGSNFLAAWADFRAGASDIYASRVSGAGTVLDASGIAVSTVANSQAAPAVAWNGSNFLVVWQDSRSGTTSDIYASRVSGAGAILDGSGIAVSTAANQQSSPVVAWNGSNFLVAWEDYRSGGSFDVYASRVSGAGVVLDASGVAVSTVAGDQYSPAVASDGSNFLVAWQDIRSGSSYDIYASRVSGAGAVLDGTGVVVSAAANGQGFPAVAWNGSNYLVAWHDFRSGAFYDIYASRFSSAGAVVDASGIAVSAAADAQIYPSVASDGENFLVAWQDARSGANSDIYASRVSGAGAVLDASGIAVWAGAGIQEFPSVAWNGANYFAAWVSTQAGGSADVLGGRVSPGGVLLDPAGIPIATSAALEDAPGATAGPSGRIVVAYRRFAQGPPYGSDRIFLRNVDDPANDLFVSAKAVSGTSGTADGVNGGAGKEVGEPNHAGNVGGGSVWYRWTAPANGVATIDTVGSQFDTLLGVYTGAAVGALTQVGANDDINAGTVQSSASFNAFTGTVYQIAVDGKNGATGPIVLRFGLAVDTTPPDTTITGGPSGSVSSTSATFTFTASEAGSALACQLDGGGFFACASPQAYTGLAQGPHTFDVRATDVFGNTDPSPASRAWTVDTVAPDTSITGGPTGTVNATTASFTFTSTEPGSMLACQLDGGALVACTSPKEYTGLSDGSHTFQVQATDAAGNVDMTPASRSWAIDATPPDTTITGGPSGSVSSTTATFTFTATEAGSTLACQMDGGGFVACASPKVYTGLSEGSHTFQVRATDSLGNTDASPASRTWTVDTTAPQTTITAGPFGTVNTTTATFTFTSSEAGSTFACQMDGGGFSACTSPKTYLGLAAGTHTFEVRATDAAGNTDLSPASRTWTIDTTAPQTTIDSGPSGIVQARTATFTFSSDEPGSFACQLDGSGFSACTSPKTYTGLADGSHTFQVRAIDVAGNIDASPASGTWTVDGSGPSVTITRPTGGLWALDSLIVPGGPLPIVIGPVTVRAVVVDNESGITGFTFEVDGTPVTSGVSYDPATKTYSFLYDASTAGMHTIVARATNGAGLSNSPSMQLLAIPT